MIRNNFNKKKPISFGEMGYKTKTIKRSNYGPYNKTLNM